ncbi:hypothetical protein AVEN_74813-1 [Araneus ventricosus]|uniref:Uncharacterized protein n=1 Tax=Araneus ventricosus TaxID=182803 RepID=A0A4Y2HP94_ARAVE|nr:hypothetical protein AVEN_74813-1 [Araneus ventricosus]
MDRVSGLPRRVCEQFLQNQILPFSWRTQRDSRNVFEGSSSFSANTLRNSKVKSTNLGVFLRLGIHERCTPRKFDRPTSKLVVSAKKEENWSDVVGTLDFQPIWTFIRYIWTFGP